MGRAVVLATHLAVPVADGLVESTADGSRSLPREKFDIPGSILEMSVDNTHPLAYGMDERTNVSFNRSPVLKLLPEAARQGVVPVAWFSGTKSLRSGWALGQHHLQGGVAVVDAKVGTGRLFLLAPEVAFRAQSHGTFKFLFNGIYYGPAVSGTQTTAQTPSR